MEKGGYSSHDVGTEDFSIILEDTVTSLPWDIKKKKFQEDCKTSCEQENYQSVRKY